MSVLRSDCRALSWRLAPLWILGAAACFHLAYLKTNFGPLPLFIIGYVVCLMQLSRLGTTSQSFYAGLVAGFLCVAPQLLCFWEIFGSAAIPLWIILAFWIAAFTGMTHASLERFWPKWTAVLVPFLWTGLEYFRSELYYLRFSWLNVGYAFADWQIFPVHFLGMYGVGFLVAMIAALFLILRRVYALGCVAVCIVISALLLPALAGGHKPQLRLAGIQMEFPSEREIPAALDTLLAKYTNADILVLCEYTLDGPVPASLKDWCRANRRYLVVGGKDPTTNNYYDTAFVVGPDGTIAFKQAKSVPIQFFKDGLPAEEQKIWESPWGKIGFCICYDLSYTRVTDRLIREGAQMLIVPTMDVGDWGEHQHELHARVAPVRAAEYGVPIFRLASSGISQAVNGTGGVTATAPFPGEGKTLFAGFTLPASGSLPVDRILAPFAVVVTAVVLLLCLRKTKRKPREPTSGLESGEAGDSNPDVSPIEKTEASQQK